MDGVINTLENQEILSSVQVKMIRKYIKDKYKGKSPKEQAVVFSDAIHKILDKELILFPKHDQMDIKKNILTQVISRRQLFLNKLDIFEAIVDLERQGGKNYSLLEKWTKINLIDMESFELDKRLYEYIYRKPTAIIEVKTNKEVEKKSRKMYMRPMNVLAALASLIFVIQIILPKTNYEITSKNTDEVISVSYRRVNEVNFDL